MAKQLSWVFELMDRITGPARAMENSLGGVQRAFDRAAKEHRALGAATKEAGDGFGWLGLKAMGWAQVGRMVGETVVGAGKLAFGAMAFREDALLGLEVVLKSKDEARKVMNDAMAFAAVTPFGTTDVMDWTKKLIVGGFRPEEAKMLLTASADFGALTGRDDDVGRLVEKFNKLNAVGRLTGEVMEQLGEAGLPVAKIYDELGRKLGLPVEQVKKLQQAGRIDSGTGINAIVQVLANMQGGQLGVMTKGKGQNLSGLWSTLTSRPSDLIMGAETGGAMGRLKDLLGRVNAALDPASESGQRISAVIGAVVDGFVTLVEWVGKGWDWVKRLFDQFALGLDLKSLKSGGDLLAALGVVAKGVGWVVTQAFEGVVRIAGWLGVAIRSVWDVFQVVGEAIGAVAFGIWFAWDWVTTKLGQLWRGMKELGTNLVRGFADGITAGVQWVIDAVSGLGDAAVKGLKGVLGIHSPSRVFTELGLNVGAGFEQGVNGSAAGATSAVEAMVRVPGSAGGRGGVTLAPGSVVVTVNGAGRGVEDQVREAVLQALASAFEQLGLEAGAA